MIRTGGTASAATARLEVRLEPETKKRLEDAAALVGIPVSEVVRTAVEEHLERMLRERIVVSTGRPARRYDDSTLIRPATKHGGFSDLPRVTIDEPSSAILDDLRSDRL